MPVPADLKHRPHSRWARGFFLVAVALATAHSHAEGQGELDACKLDKPPAIAKRIVGAAFDLLVYPAALPHNYTGCRQAWLGDGRRFVTVQFIAGMPREVRVTEPKGRTIACSFSAQGRLLSGPPEECGQSAWLRFPG